MTMMTPPSLPLLSQQECQEILGHYLSLSKSPEQQRSFAITQRLSIEEQEIAASACSYAYWVARRQYPQILTEEIRFATAQREAFRHTDGVPELEDSVRFLKATIQFHVDQKTHLYRTCLHAGFDSTYEDPSDVKLAMERRNRIRRYLLDTQTMVIRGHDKDLNAIWACMPRRKTTTNGDEEDIQVFVDTLIYIIERALACTEALSKGTRDRIVSVMDAKNSSCPSLQEGRSVIPILQSYYPSRLKNFVILDLPYVIKGITNLVKPILDPDTRSKFILVNGAKQTNAALSKLVDASQAPPNYLSTGKLTAPVSVTKFLEEVPFHCLYDDTHHVEKEHQKPVMENTQAPKVATGRHALQSPTKVKSLAVGSMTRCLTRIEVLSQG